MDYQLFLEEIKEYVLKNLKWNISEENYKLYLNGYAATNDEELMFIRNTNIKYNHMECDTLIGDFIDLRVATTNNGSTSCRFSVKYLYDEYLAEGWEKVDYIISENIRMAASANVEEISTNIKDYSCVRERLIIRPINFTDNRYELKNCIYEKIGDIALVLYVLLYENAEMGLGTMKVQKGMFDTWGKKRSKVWQEALVNTNVWAPPRMYTNQDDLANPPYAKGAFMAVNSKIEKIGPLFPPVVTTTKKQNGAIAMFYPGVQEKISEICGGSYYVSFTSIDDVRIHPKGTLQPRQILQLLKDVNKGFNKPEDILSRKLFFYNHEKKMLDVMEL